VVVLSIGKVSADAGWAYLARQVAHGVEDYYRAGEAAGEAPGVWVGASERLLGLAGGVQEAAFKSVYADHADPRSGETLGRTRRVYRSLGERLGKVRAELAGAVEEELAAAERAVRRSDRVSVDAFDVTFSPVKSVSVLWAAGDAGVRREVWAAQRAAVGAALEVLGEQAAYTRTGRHTNRADERRRGRYEDADGLVAAAFEHRMSRAGDPQIHTHVLLANLTRTCSDGKWRTLDGDALYRAKDAAAGVYDQVLATELTRRLGVAWRLRADGKAWEIAGIGEHARRLFSARRVQITAQLAPLVEAFSAARGRAPSGWELTRMSQWSTLTNRPRKGPAESTTEAAGRWAVQFAQANGRLLADLPGSALGRAASPTALDVDAVAADALRRLAGKRASWDRADLAREVAFSLGGHVDPRLSPAGVRARVDAVTDAALARAGVVKVTAEELLAVPEGWRRRDGESVFVAPHSARYTVDAQLAVEARVAAAASERTPLAVGRYDVEAALAGYRATGRGRLLTAEQAAAVAGIAGSGLRLQALVGPAGTGKTTTMDALRTVWQAAAGGRVVGLSPSQIAATVLQAQAGPDLTANTSRWLHRARVDPRRWGLQAGDLVVLDEASMVADTQLGDVLAHAAAAGARVLLAGDPAQLPSPAAGAAYGMLTRIPGAAMRLAEVHRFDAGWERAASLRLRAGDPTGLDDYDRRARIIGGSREQAEQRAWRAWAADTARGLSSLLITSTTADVTVLNERARAARIGAGQVEDTLTVGLADGTRAGAGDRIVTRRNTTVGDGAEVVNRARWQVHTVLADGSLRCAMELPDGAVGAPVRLPADYVARHVELGYATTAYGAQGLTVDTAHAVVGIDGVDREALYVMASRGRRENHLYVQTRVDNGEGELLRTTPALAVLAGSLARVGGQLSATETRAADADAVRSTATLAPIAQSLAAGEAARRHAATVHAVLPAQQAARLAGDPAGPALWAEAFAAEIRGVDVTGLLRAVTASRDVGDAESVAQVLRWRLAVEVALHPPTGQWTGWRGLLHSDPDAAETAVLAQAARLLDRRITELGARAATRPPGWAAERLGPAPDSGEGRQQWQAAAGLVAAWREYAGVPDTDPAVIGPPPNGPQPLAGVLWAAADQALGRPTGSAAWQDATGLQLQRLSDRGRRATQLAPPYVDQQLNAAHRELRQARTTLGEAHAAAPTRPTGYPDLVAAGWGRVARREAWVRTVEGKAERRAAWYTAAGQAISQGARAERELNRRARLDITDRGRPTVASRPAPDDETQSRQHRRSRQLAEAHRHPAEHRRGARL